MSPKGQPKKTNEDQQKTKEDLKKTQIRLKIDPRKSRGRLRVPQEDQKETKKRTKSQWKTNRRPKEMKGDQKR